MSKTELLITLESHIENLDGMLNSSEITDEAVESYQHIIDSVDHETREKNISNSELSKLYELQALVFAAQGKSDKADTFIDESARLVGGVDHLTSRRMQDYMAETNSKKVFPSELPYVLTDEPKVISAMKWIQRAGLWASAIAILYIPTTILFVIIDPGERGAFMLLGAPIAAYLLYSGYILNKLDGGQYIGTMLVVNMMIGAFLVSGLFPILLFITSIIALFKISNFKRWWDLNEEYYYRTISRGR